MEKYVLPTLVKYHNFWLISCSVCQCPVLSSSTNEFRHLEFLCYVQWHNSHHQFFHFYFYAFLCFFLHLYPHHLTYYHICYSIWLIIISYLHYTSFILLLSLFTALIWCCLLNAQSFGCSLRPLEFCRPDCLLHQTLAGFQVLLWSFGLCVCVSCFWCPVFSLDSTVSFSSILPVLVPFTSLSGNRLISSGLLLSFTIIFVFSPWFSLYSVTII